MAKKAVNEVFEYISKYHIDGPKAEQLMEGAIGGMIDTLNDPYTEYLAREELNQFTDNLKGDYAGVGLYLAGGLEYPEVLEVFNASPAMKAGIMAGDKIRRVNGVDVRGWPLSSVVDKIKGPAETEVVLTINRNDSEIVYTLRRATLNVPSVESKIMSDRTGYICVKSFGSRTSEEFKATLKGLMSIGINGLVIDLRDNPGGYFHVALEMAEIFLKPGTPVVTTIDRNGHREGYLAGENKETVMVPVVILINSSSASSSEIFAAALQDNAVGTLVGENSYGKGVVQHIIMLETGGALKLTTAEYITPNGRSINNLGLRPDFEVLTRELQLPFALSILNPQSKKIVFTPGSSEVMVSNEKITTFYKPFINNGTVYLPLRFTFEALGYTVSWKQEFGSIIVAKKDKKIIVPLITGSPVIDGKELLNGKPVYIEKGVSYMPIELLKALGVTCNQEGSMVIVEG